MSEKPTALRIAEWFEGGYGGCESEAAAELRRLHEANQKLQQQLGEAVWNYGEKVRANQELLEALKLALGTLLSSAGCHDNPRSVEAIKAIRAAITKGEQA